MSAVLLAALIAVPAFAQTEKQTVSKVAKAVEQAALKARQKAQQKICAYCGEEITSRYQHCSAKGYVGLCSEEKTQAKQPSSSWAPTHCDKCGEKLTIDERYHGAEHHCNSAAEQQTKYCIYCGEEIKTKGQACAEGGTCTVSCPECGADLRDPANLNAQGVHHCRFKVHIKPVPAKK